MFGTRMGFVKFKGEITDEQGRVIPSIVFMRGASVGMFVCMFVCMCIHKCRAYAYARTHAHVYTLCDTGMLMVITCEEDKKQYTNPKFASFNRQKYKY